MGSRAFLDRHPELERLKKESPTWQQLKDRHGLKGLDEELYLVGGDTLGSEDDLLVDALVRGSPAEGADALAHRLFEEISTEMKHAVLSELLQSDTKGEPK
jgi:hypothetical protein